jgi:hypothetical protein
LGAGTGLRLRRLSAVVLITSGGSGTEALVEPGRLRKVNRCLTEGRQAFVRRLAGIQGGVECERFAPLLLEWPDGRVERLGQAVAIDASVVAVAVEAAGRGNTGAPT